MAYTDDWENLMNGVFGPGGKLRFDTQKTPPEKPGLPDMNAALLEQQKKLDEMLRKQNAELRRDTTQEALAQSRKMLEDMEADGLLAKGTTEVRQEHLGSFEGLAAEVKKTVLGQDAFVDGVVRAMRRPFVLGTEAPTARNVILLCGAPGTGRHFALTETARCMAARGLLQSDKLAVMDLALYPDSGAEKLFLQDLYAALHAPGEILVFEHYESCYPGFFEDAGVTGNSYDYRFCLFPTSTGVFALLVSFCIQESCCRTCENTRDARLRHGCRARSHVRNRGGSRCTLYAGRPRIRFIAILFHASNDRAYSNPYMRDNGLRNNARQQAYIR